MLPLVAAPLTRVTAVPTALPSTSNWTDPVGTAPPRAAEAAVAVIVIAWPASGKGLLAVNVTVADADSDERLMAAVPRSFDPDDVSS